VSPSVIAVVVGLGAVTAMSAACQKEDPADDDGSGGDGDGGEWLDDDDGSGGPGAGYPSAVSTYGVGPSSSISTSTGIDPTCTAFDNGTDCGSCLNAYCCDPGVACTGSPDCLTFMTCLSACAPDDLPCAADCQAESPDGYTLYQAMYQCGEGQCPGCIQP
jgi:hypothetical protein